MEVRISYPGGITKVNLSSDGSYTDGNINVSDKWAVRTDLTQKYDLSTRVLNSYGILNPSYTKCTVSYFDTNGNKIQSGIEGLIFKTKSSLRIYDNIFFDQYDGRLFKREVIDNEEDCYEELFGQLYKDISTLQQANISINYPEKANLVYQKVDNLKYVNYKVRLFKTVALYNAQNDFFSPQTIYASIYSIMTRECSINKTSSVDNPPLWFSRFAYIGKEKNDLVLPEPIVLESISVSKNLKERNKDFYGCMMYDQHPNILRINYLLRKGVNIFYMIDRLLFKAHNGLISLFDKIGSERFANIMSDNDTATQVLLSSLVHMTTTTIVNIDTVRNTNAYNALVRRLLNRGSYDKLLQWYIANELPDYNLLLNRIEPKWKIIHTKTMWNNAIMIEDETYVPLFFEPLGFAKFSKWSLSTLLNIPLSKRALSTYILIRYLSVSKSNVDLELYFYCSLIIAYNYLPRDMLQYLVNPYSEQQLYDGVNKILCTLDGKILFPNVIDFIELAENVLGDIVDWDLVKTIAVMLSIERNLYYHKASKVALAIICYCSNVSEITIGEYKYTNTDMVKYIQYCLYNVSGQFLKEHQFQKAITFMKQREFFSYTMPNIDIQKNAVYMSHQQPIISFGVQIGGGTYGKVVIAKSNGVLGDINVQDKYAVKIQNLEHSISFTKEVMIMCTLKHPNLQTCTSFDIKDDQLLIQMDLAKSTLTSEIYKNYNRDYSINYFRDVWIKGKGLPPVMSRSLTQKYIVEILSGLSFLHYNGVIHCDLKPDNILIGKDNVARITDYGLSDLRCRGYMDYSPKTCNVVTIMYRDINLLLPGCEYYSFDIDIWSMAIIYMEMFTGVCPTVRTYKEQDVIDRYNDLLSNKQWHKLFTKTDAKMLHSMLDYNRINRPTADACITMLSSFANKPSSQKNS